MKTRSRNDSVYRKKGLKGRKSSSPVRVGTGKPRESATSQALRLLSRRPRTVREIEAKLKEMGHSPQTVKGVVAHLKKARLVDDETLAFEIASSRVLHKYWGSSRIVAHLQGRGILPTIIQSTVRRIWQENDEVEVARRAVCHRFKDTTFAEASDRDKTKMVNYLRRLGFSWDLVHEVLR